MPRKASQPERVLERIDWTVIRRLDGLLQGDYRTLFQGFGLDLADLREYQFGDDVRCIDWNVTARMQETHVRRYLEDREITAWFLLDLTASLDFGTVQARKRDLLVDFTAVLARLLTRHGNRIGALLYDGETIRVLPAMGGRLAVLRLLHELSAEPDPSGGAPPADRRESGTNLAELLETADRVVRRRSLIFVISDFFSAPGWAQPLGRLTRRHEVLGVRLHDPRETDIPDLGILWFEDAETGEQILLDTGDRGFRHRFAEAALRHARTTGEAFLASGTEALTLSTEEDMTKAVLRFAGRRKRRRGAVK